MIKVEDVKVGDYVKRKPTAAKVYKRCEYNHETKRYTLQDVEDISRFIEVKNGTELFTEFEY